MVEPYPSEKWWSESQSGWWHSQYMENKSHVPNQQPLLLVPFNFISWLWFLVLINYKLQTKMLLNMGWKSVVFIGCLTYNDIVESKYSESKYIVNQIYIYTYIYIVNPNKTNISCRNWRCLLLSHVMLVNFIQYDW